WRSCRSSDAPLKLAGHPRPVVGVAGDVGDGELAGGLAVDGEPQLALLEVAGDGGPVRAVDGEAAGDDEGKRLTAIAVHDALEAVGAGDERDGAAARGHLKL